ncbi:MAG: hypothetical protein NVSMB22_01470 [Chloroflexota bacterium]
MTSNRRDAVGLVLGAGGVRGCAHAGVTEVLKAEGIPIDYVVGASVGAIFGLAVAAGVPAEHVSKLTRESRPWDLFRFYASRLRTEKRNPIARLVYEAAVGKTFDDLDVPFAVLVTDMATGLPAIIDRGPILPAVEASFALPFIGRPVQLNGSYYLDGGIRASTPVHVARDMGADRIIAVHLGSNLAFAGPRQRAWARSMAERVGRQRRPIADRLTDQIRFSCRLYADGYGPAHPGFEADVSIRPQFEGVSQNSVTGGRYCYFQGIKAARAVLHELQDWPRVPVPFHQPYEEIT